MFQSLFLTGIVVSLLIPHRRVPRWVLCSVLGRRSVLRRLEVLNQLVPDFVKVLANREYVSSREDIDSISVSLERLNLV